MYFSIYYYLFLYIYIYYTYILALFARNTIFKYCDIFYVFIWQFKIVELFKVFFLILYVLKSFFLNTR